MAKSISTAQQAALNASHCMTVAFIQIDWRDTGPERCVTAGADMSWGGHTWEGIGDVIEFSAVIEEAAVVATGVSMKMSGVMSSAVARSLLAHFHGQKVTIWFGVLDPETSQLIGEPIKEWEGLMDAPTIEDGETSVISINVESRMASLLGASVRRYTDADQQQHHPGDTFFLHAAKMAERLIVFPSAQAQRR